MKTNQGLLAIVALAVVDLGLFLISGLPRFRHATEGTDAVIGNVCWAGFLLGTLALIITGAVVLVRRVRGARSASAER